MSDRAIEGDEEYMGLNYDRITELGHLLNLLCSVCDEATTNSATPHLCVR